MSPPTSPVGRQVLPPTCHTVVEILLLPKSAYDLWRKTKKVKKHIKLHVKLKSSSIFSIVALGVTNQELFAIIKMGTV